MAVGINIVTGFDGGGIEKALKEFNKLETTAERTKFAIQKAALPAAVALAGIAAAAGLATKAAIEDQEQQAKLAQTLRTATGATQEQIAAVEGQVSALMKVSTFSDDELRPALANLVQATQDVSRSQQLMGLAMDISVATGVPLIAVTDALAKAENGQMKALATLAPTVRENVKEGASLNEVYTKLGEVFGGAALAQTKTAAGQMQMFKNQVGELSESFGMMLIPIVQAVLPVMSRLASFAENNKVAFLVLVGAVGLLSAAILAATAVIKLHALAQALMKIKIVETIAATNAASIAMTAFKAAMTGLLAAGVFAAVFSGLSAIANAAKDADGKIDNAGKSMTIALSKFAQIATPAVLDVKKVIGDFQILAAQMESKSNFSDLWTSWGKEIDLFGSGAVLDIESFDKAFKKVMETSPQAAQQLVRALEAQLSNVPKTSQAYADLTMLIDRYRTQVNLTTDAQNALNAGFVNTLTLADVVRNTINTGIQAKYDDMRMNNANADTLKKFQREVHGLSSAVGKATKSIKDRLGDYRQAVEGLGNAKQSLVDASQAVVDAQQKVKDSANAVTQAERNAKKAADELADAVKGVAKAQEATKTARSNYASSLADTAKAQAKLKTATQSVAEAQEAFNAAVRGYGAGSKQGKTASRQLADAQQQTEQSAYDLEKAQFAIIDAEAELAEIRADAEATPQAIREAEIALAEAKLGLVDAQERQVDSQDGLTAATDHYNQMLNGVRADSEIYKDLLADLNAAKQAEQEAIEAVSAAREREADMLAKIQEALDGEAEAAKRVEDAKWNLAEAERDIEAAKRDQAAAIRDVARAQLDEAKALYEVAKAQREVNEARNAAPAPGVARIDAEFAAIAALIEATDASSTSATANEGSNGTRGSSGFFEVAMLAKGGVVMSPTAAIVGEAGPEAVVPLDRIGGLGTTINVTVNAGMGANGDQVGKAVVDALRQYQRHNGAIPITVA